MNSIVITRPTAREANVHSKGIPIAIMMHSSERLIENWVNALAKNANVRIDWRYGKKTVVKCFGDDDAVERAKNSVKKLKSAFEGRIIIP